MFTMQGEVGLMTSLYHTEVHSIAAFRHSRLPAGSDGRESRAILSCVSSVMKLKSKLKALIGMGLLAVAGVAHAAWPERPVTLVVPFPPGGSTDV